MAQPEGSRVDVREHGANQQTSSRRLYMQLQAFGDCDDPKRLTGALERARVEGVLYADVADPLGVGRPGHRRGSRVLRGSVAGASRDASRSSGSGESPSWPCSGAPTRAASRPTSRTGSSARPRRTALAPEWPWAIWYPLRRTGTFARLTPQEQGAILKEHAVLGRTYGEADLAHDVRLACHGLDTHDNDFVIGLVGRELHPLSHLVQTMRRTAQTAEFIQTLGPFFVGPRALARLRAADAGGSRRPGPHARLQNPEGCLRLTSQLRQRLTFTFMKVVKHRRRRGHTRVSAKNQATIPVAALRRAGLRPGSTARRWRLPGAGRIVLSRVEETLATLRRPPDRDLSEGGPEEATARVAIVVLDASVVIALLDAQDVASRGGRDRNW